VVALFPTRPRLATTRRAAWRAAAEGALMSVRYEDEELDALSYVYIGLRPWILDLVLAGAIVRMIIPQGVLVVTSRRLLLFGADQLSGTLNRVERAQDLAGVRVRTHSPVAFRPRLVLSIQGQSDLQVTFPWSWRSSAQSVVAAIERHHSSIG
jgi:hypothetical protein